jgi:hypothetical protein
MFAASSNYTFAQTWRPMGSDTQPATDVAAAAEAIRTILKSQYHASLAMLGETIRRCPDEIWFARDHLNAFWQIAYHTLFFAHAYMQPTQEDFKPWEGHQADVQNPDAIPGPPDPDSTVPLIPEPYSRDEVLKYWAICDAMVNDAVDAIDVLSPDSGFWRYPIPKLEHQLVNIRHIQHGAAQLADRLRAAAGIGIDWAGARRARAAESPAAQPAATSPTEASPAEAS